MFIGIFMSISLTVPLFEHWDNMPVVHLCTKLTEYIYLLVFFFTFCLQFDGE
jgi:hypothetical protein